MHLLVVNGLKNAKMTQLTLVIVTFLFILFKKYIYFKPYIVY